MITKAWNVDGIYCIEARITPKEATSGILVSQVVLKRL